MEPPKKKFKMALLAIGEEFLRRGGSAMKPIVLWHLSSTILQKNRFEEITLSIQCLEDEHVRITNFYEEWIGRYLDYDFYILFR
jgi:hypothetical protein